jgi:hypothetical protein
MSVAEFLNAVLPTQGSRFVLTTFGKQGDADFRPGQQVYGMGETAALIERCAWGSRSGANSYFAVAGFMLGLNEKGNPSRAAKYAVWHRCLRMDVDVGAGKPYGTKREALLAVLGMTAHYQMPKPWLVDSGGGVHVYWAFDRDVSLQEWIGYAGRLRAACETYGLQGDHTTTIDAARVLRMPGTLNNKPEYVATGTPPEVKILQRGDSVGPDQVTRYLPAADAIYTNASLPPFLRAQRNDEFQQNLHQPYFMRDMLQQCPGLLAMVHDAGARATEPLWKATLDLVNKSDDTDAVKYKVARGMSKGHPKFTEEGFAQKWAQVVAQGYHPPTCGRMAAAGMTECATCPLRGKISSPLVLGRPTYHAPSDAAVPPQPAPSADPNAELGPSPPPVANLVPVAAPSGNVFQMGVFIIDPASSIIKVVDGRMTTHLSISDGYPTGATQVDDPNDPSGKKWVNKKLLDYRLLRIERLLDAAQRRSSVVITFQRERDGEAAVEFENADFAEPKSFYKKMQGEGLYCTRKQVAEFMDRFMTELLQQMQRARAAAQIAGRCGWTEDFTSFVLGQQLYRNDGAVENIRASGAVGEMEGYHSAGNYDRWRKAFDIALSGGVDRQCVLALSIAGPLMAFTGVDGVMMNVYSPESGVGKSTLGDAAISIWGSPKTLVKNFRDTNNATFKLAATNGNMPLVIDEFTNIEGKYLSDYIYTLTQGREKHRLGADAKFHAPAQRWCLAAICTSNNSVHEKLQDFRRDAEAEAARVFELRLRPLHIDPAQSGQIKLDLQALRTDYGFLGPELVKLFMAKPADYWRQQVMARIARWDQHHANGVSDRFRSATCALIEVGALLGKAMGYAFDTGAIGDVLRSHWTKQVVEFEAERKNPADFVRSYVMRHMTEFVMFGGADGKQVINIGSLPKRFMGEVRGKAVNGTFKPDTMMIPVGLLRSFIRDDNGSYRPVMEWMKAGGALRHGRLLYLDGTSMSMHVDAAEFRYDAVMGSGATVTLAAPGGANVAATA